jgi:hypothetical protein
MPAWPINSNQMNSHKFDIRSTCHPNFSSNVAIHFDSVDHSLDDFSFMPIDKVHDNMGRLLKETYWIHKLETFCPKGLQIIKSFFKYIYLKLLTNSSNSFSIHIGINRLFYFSSHLLYLEMLLTYLNLTNTFLCQW